MSKQPSVYRPEIEALEQRDLMASNLHAYVLSNTLVIDGTAANDYISVTQTAGKIAVYGTTITTGNGSANSVDASSISKILINGYAGNDIISVSSAITKDATIYGGAGNDQIWGGSGNDTIDGGAGNDVIWGGAGNDRLKGGDSASENDVLNGGSGFDWYYRPFNPTTPIVNGLEVSDVRQGSTPLCQTIAALAEGVKQGHNFGADIKYLGGTNYQVQLHGNLGAQTVSYDGWSSDNDPPPASGEFWALLLQRARLQGLGINPNQEYSTAQWNALNTNSGGRLYSIGEALYNFTGSTSVFSDISAANPQSMQASLARGDSIVVASRSASGYTSPDGIVGNHAYAVMAVYNEGGVWKVRLYNPWGTDRENGSTLDSLDKTRPAANDGFITLTWAQFTNPANFKSVFLAKNNGTGSGAAGSARE